MKSRFTKNFLIMSVGPIGLILGILLTILSPTEGVASVLQNGKKVKKFPYPVKKQEPTISLVAVGDVMLDRYVRNLIERNGFQYPFQHIENSLFQESDILLGNLEGPVVSKKTKFGPVTFGMLPDSLPQVRDFGFDIFSLANNHALDQGWPGHEATKKFLTEIGIEWFGHPKGELTRNSILFKTVKGKVFAFVGLTDVYNAAGEEGKMVETIHRVVDDIRDEADYIIVFPHWGIEYTRNPSKRQEAFAHAFIDAGVDIVIGHHPHWVQISERYKGKLIYYSLGNFIFDQYWSKETQRGLVLKVFFRGKNIWTEEYPFESIKSQPVIK